jgi:hypothetical protein
MGFADTEKTASGWRRLAGGLALLVGLAIGPACDIAPRFSEQWAILAVQTAHFGLSRYNFGELVRYWVSNVEWSAKKSGDGHDVVATGNFKMDLFTSMYGNNNDPVYIKFHKHAIDQGGGLTFVEFRVGRRSFSEKDYTRYLPLRYSRLESQRNR